jgi:TonB-dependent receptor
MKTMKLVRLGAAARRVLRPGPRMLPTAPLRFSPVAAACVLLLSADFAQAQTASSAPAQEIVITGIRRSIETSIATKRESDSIVEAISAEDLGKLPDASIAEALARLPGLTGQRGPDGRVNVITIRGLSPAFSGALLNGREVVSSNDGRAVEYDQFPSELVGSAVVYKTPDAALIGQGLSGTVDIKSLRPLSLASRQIAVNLRGERNSNGDLAPGTAPKTGSRFSFSYVDQFADRTLGLAVGYARLDAATNVKLTELVEYGDYSPYGLPLSGNAKSKFPMADGSTGNSLLPMFWSATSSSKRNTRDGLMAVLEYKPNDALHSQLDLYYSKFDTHEVGGKFLSSLFATWGGGVAPNLSNVQTTQIGQNTLTTSARADLLPVTTGNFDTRRKDDITAIGWNTTYKLSPKWSATADISYSRDVRNETYAEAYAAPFDNAKQQWIYSGFDWNVSPYSGGKQTFTPVQANWVSSPGIVKLGDQQGFDFVGDQDAYTGAIRNPHIKDEIKALRLSSKTALEGIFSQFTGGLNYTERAKNINKNESRLLMKKDAAGNYIRDIPAGALGTPFDMSWAGIPSLIRYDVPSLVGLGTVSLQPLFSQRVDNDSSVKEKVTTVYGQFDIDTSVAGLPVRGNVGVQAVHTQQSAEGWEYRGNNATPDISLLFRRSGGTSYDDVLPSLNLVTNITPSLITRFGLARTLARPNMVDMRAGTSTPTVVTDLSGPHVGEWTTAYSGNPALKPWRADSIDLSIEKYFGKRSYVSFAAFRKNLLNYIFNGLSTRDNTGFPAVTPPGVTAKQFGPVVQPLNGSGGKIEGLELSASLEGGLLHPVLEGFGVVMSGSKLSSSIRDKDNGNVSLNGLSGLSNSITAYYERSGYSARVSQTYRSAFTATTRDIFLNSTTRQQEAVKTVDLQLGYSFEEGPAKGLSLLLQVINLTDTPGISTKSAGANAPDPTMLLPNFSYRFGRTTLMGANYKF